MLYESSRHLALTNNSPWDPENARNAIREVLFSTRRGLDVATGLWPIHTKDHYPGAPSVLTNFYFGAAGVVWAVNELNEFDDEGAGGLVPSMDDVLIAHLAAKPSGIPDREAYFLGEAGIRFLLQASSPCEANGRVLKELLKSSMTNKYRELLYGAPGTLLMAHLLRQKNHDPEMHALCMEIAARLMAERELDALSGA